MIYAIVAFGGLLSEYSSRIRLSTEEIETIINDLSRSRSSEELIQTVQSSTLSDPQKEIVVKIASNPDMVVGPLVKEEPLISYAADIAAKWELPMVSTGDAYKAFNEVGVETRSYGLVEITNLLQDPNWKGVRGEGQHDLVIFMDRTPREGAQAVEEVLQAVKVPLVIGGSGDPKKDPLVLEAAAAVAEGERCLLASANLDLDYKKVAKAALDHNHDLPA